MKMPVPRLPNVKKIFQTFGLVETWQGSYVCRCFEAWPCVNRMSKEDHVRLSAGDRGNPKAVHTDTHICNCTLLRFVTWDRFVQGLGLNPVHWENCHLKPRDPCTFEFSDLYKSTQPCGASGQHLHDTHAHTDLAQALLTALAPGIGATTTPTKEASCEWWGVEESYISRRVPKP